MTLRRCFFTLALFGVASCDPPPAVDIRFELQADPNVCDLVGDIQSVRVMLIGGRSGVACIESSQCIELDSPVNAIHDVQARIGGVSFDVVAARGYQLEVSGYAMAGCSLGASLDNFLFCGRSNRVRFDEAGTGPISVPATCALDALDCRSASVSLGLCL